MLQIEIPGRVGLVRGRRKEANDLRLHCGGDQRNQENATGLRKKTKREKREPSKRKTQTEIIQDSSKEHRGLLERPQEDQIRLNN